MNTKIFISSCSSDLKELRERITDTLKEQADVWSQDLQHINPGDNWHELIQSKITSCDAVLLLVGNELRDNVLYEAGVATGAGKQIILIAASDAGIPAPLRNYPAVFFDPNALESEETVSTVCRALEQFTWQSSKKTSRTFSSALENLKDLAKRSKELDEIDPLRFENLVMDVLREIGWHVHQSAPDAGYDFVARWPAFQECELFVECKKLSTQKMVGMEPLLKLANAVRLSKASRGLLITTAPLTASAAGFLHETKDRLLVLQVKDLVSNPKRVTTFCSGKVQLGERRSSRVSKGRIEEPEDNS